MGSSRPTMQPSRPGLACITSPVSFSLPAARLERLREQLQARGRSRKSLYVPSAQPDVLEAVEFLDEYGAMVEILYIMMVADRRLLNVEREVCRGALDVLSAGRVRTAHMDAMLDASAKSLARHGADKCLERSIAAIRDDALKAETTFVVAAVVAIADGQFTVEEQDVLSKLAFGFSIDEQRTRNLLEELTAGALSC